MTSINNSTRQCLLVLCLAAAFSLLNASHLFAQMPAVPEEMKKLGMILGSWEGKGVYSVGAKNENQNLTLRGTKASGGWGILITVTSNGKSGTYYETDLLAFNPEDKKIHMFTVSNAGEIHDQVCTWATDKKNTFMIRYEGTSDGKPMLVEAQIIFVSAKEIMYRSVTTVNGGPGPVFEAKMKKK